MKFIIGFVMVLVIDITFGAGNTIDGQTGPPEQLTETTINSETVTAGYLNTRISDLKSIADTLPDATADDANKTLSKLGPLVSALLNSIQNNLGYYISNTPNFKIDVATAFGHVIDSLETLIGEATTVSGSLTGDTIALVEGKLLDSANATRAFSNLISKVTNDSSITAQISKEFVAYLKIVADGAQQFFNIFNADIGQMLFNTVKSKLQGIISDIVISVNTYGHNNGEELENLKTVVTETTYKTIRTAFTEAFHLLPSKYDHLLTKIMGDVILNQAATKDFVGKARPDDKDQSISDLKSAALKPIEAVLNVIESVASAIEETSEHVTPVTNQILLVVEEIVSYNSQCTHRFMKWISNLIDNLHDTNENPLSDVVLPLRALEISLDGLYYNIDVKWDSDASKTYSAIGGVINDAKTKLSADLATLTANRI